MGRTRAGIRDVATLAQVSVTTVSHVLNDAPGARVSAETRARVQQAARELEYSPNRAARTLRTRRSGIIGMVSDLIATTPYAGQMVLGAQEAAIARGHTMTLINTGGDARTEQRQVRALLQHQIDGVVYAAMYHRRVTVPAELADVPTVLLDAVCDGDARPSVIPDEIGGGRRAVALLLEHGHRRIGFVTNQDDIPATHGRLLGYQQALATAGIVFDPALVLAHSSETDGGYLAARTLLTRPDRPTALFCFNDRMAMGTYRAAAELGLTIPGQLSVVGFDNQPIVAEGLYPGLTTVELPHHAMGHWAMTALLDAMEAADPARGPFPPVVMPTPLVRRGSVGPPASDEGDPARVAPS